MCEIFMIAKTFFKHTINIVIIFILIKIVGHTCVYLELWIVRQENNNSY